MRLRAIGLVGGALAVALAACRGNAPVIPASPATANRIAGVETLASPGAQRLFVASLYANDVRAYTAPYRGAGRAIEEGIGKPWALTVDAGGDLFVADIASNAVTVYPSPYASPSAVVTAGVLFPQAVAADGFGNLFVANLSGNTVTMYAPPYTGVPLTIARRVAAPYALALDARGDLFVANAPRRAATGYVTIYRPPYAAPPVVVARGLGVPHALALDAKGDLFVASGAASFRRAAVAIYAPPYSGKPILVRTGITAPAAIAVDASGTLFVANGGKRGSVAVVEPPYTKGVRLLTQRIVDPRALALDRSGRLYVANGGAKGVTIYAPPYRGQPGVVANGVRKSVALAFSSPNAGARVPQTIGVPGATVALDNPLERGKPAAAQRVAIPLSELDPSNAVVQGKYRYPIAVHVYGPNGIVAPEETIVASSRDAAAFALRYSGAFFTTPLTVTFVAANASATMQLVPERHPACDAYARMHRSLHFAQPQNRGEFEASGFHVMASIGGGPMRSVQLDTGSIGLVVGPGAIGPDAIGPGAPGTQDYTSDGLILTGNYYLAPVKLQTATGFATTVPMEVLVVTGQSCASDAAQCTPFAHGFDGIGVMGVGFDRGGSDGTLPKPLDRSAFNQVQDVVDGAMHPGYIVSRHDVQLGLTSANLAPFTGRTQQLQPSTSVPFDWLTEPGCFAFPAIASQPKRFCGTMLVDIGIDSMIVAASPSPPPPVVQTTSTGERIVPSGTAMRVAFPAASGSLLRYGFRVGESSAENPLAPASVRWAAGTNFVNTGRNLIEGYDYLYDAGCGKVGFRKHS